MERRRLISGVDEFKKLDESNFPDWGAYSRATSWFTPSYNDTNSNSHNPDKSKYILYRSGLVDDNSCSELQIWIYNQTTFTLYVKSGGEPNYDYVMVSQLDKKIDETTIYSDTTLVKAHTRGNPNSGTALSNYTKVTFTGIDKGLHCIYIIYRKDSSGSSGSDTAWALIPKNTNLTSDYIKENYLTIKAVANSSASGTPSMSFLIKNTDTNSSFEYCINGDGYWRLADESCGGILTPVKAGDCISFRNGSMIKEGYRTYFNNSMFGPVGYLSYYTGNSIYSLDYEVSGNIMSLLAWGFNIKKMYSLNYYDVGNLLNYTFSQPILNYGTSSTTLQPQYINKNYMLSPFSFFFTYPSYTGNDNSVNVKVVSERIMPATKLSQYCYYRTYSSGNSGTNITSLRLPALNLRGEYASCYEYMFCNNPQITDLYIYAENLDAAAHASQMISGAGWNVSGTKTVYKTNTSNWINETTNGTTFVPSNWVTKTFIPKCTALRILNADNCNGKDTTTTVYYEAIVDGFYYNDCVTSDPFPQNTSTTSSINRTVTISFYGKTASTTITQGVYKATSYTVNLNSQ